MSIDFDSIRARNPIREYLDRIAWIGRPSGSNLIGKCPIHRESNGASFTVNPGLGKWICFGKCSRSGDVIDLEQELGGGTLAQAAARLVGGELPRVDLVSRGAIQTPNKPVHYTMTRDELTRMAQAAHRLASNPELFYQAIGPRPEISLEAIRGAALDGDLGVEDGKVFFGYRYGIKQRWRVKGERHISWLCGAAHGECWRQSLLVSSHRRIVVSEGETDALAVISLGIERPGELLIIALAGASILPDPEPFRGRCVVFIPDPDRAGEIATEKFRARLEPVAKSFKAISIGEVTHG